MIVYAAKDESDEAAIARYIKEDKHDRERLKYFVLRFYNTARRGMAKALGEGKIIVYAQEGESDETAIARHIGDAGPRTGGYSVGRCQDSGLARSI